MRNALFPAEGRPWPEVRAALHARQADDVRWNEGRMLTSSYVIDGDHVRLLREASADFLVENAIYAGEFASKPGTGFGSLVGLRDELLAMVLELFNAPAGAGGTLTSGGTESILLAVLGAREWAKRHRPHVRAPRIVVARTAHAAFDKAAFYFGLTVTRVPHGADCRADVQAMADALDDDVIMLVGSAPCYPFGVFDPLADLARLAAERDIWFHIDACVGGYLAPFVKRLGHPVPDFDLGLPGVWSLSADLHKYGFAPKNLSSVLYRDASLRELSTFSFEDWPAGAYTTAGMGGSRTGGPIAATWALFHVLGEAGYLEAARTIMATRERLYAGLDRLGLRVHGRPELGLVSYGTDALDMAAVADAIDERRWSIGRGLDPDRIINLINPINAGSIDVYLGDLEAAVAAARAGRRRSATAAVYTRG
jgi:glutamate/tyrosine decarboxylase-like PLP-dependent enzyme